MDNHGFRNALSGFNRQDVLEYIERTQKESAETIARLEEQTQQLRQECGEVRGELDACQEEKEELSRQLEDMTLRYNHAKNNWEAQAQAKASFRQDVAQRDQTVRELTEENQTLFRRVQALEDQLDAMRLEKERIAQLELDAHHRADEIVAAAQAQAEELSRNANREASDTVAAAQAQAEETTRNANREASDTVASAQAHAEETLRAAHERAQALLGETEETVGAAAAQYDQLFQSFTAITDHISSELRKLDVAASQLPVSFNHLKEGLHQLHEKAKERPED